jgi:hypothetical protein
MAGRYGHEITLTIHGLSVDNGDVRADAFLSEFRALINSLKLGDRELNRKQSHAYLVVDLNIGRSASATIRETVTRVRSGQRKLPPLVPVSSVPYVGAAVESIYNGDPGVGLISARLLHRVADLTKDIESSFSHAELAFEDNKVIRIDDYFTRQVKRALERLGGAVETELARFRGVSFDSFDGILKEADSRGVVLRGKLVLTGGNTEVDCIFNSSDMPAIRESLFDRRVRVGGISHYDGTRPVPERLDVKKITPIKVNADLLRWRGVLLPREGHDEEDENHNEEDES